MSRIGIIGTTAWGTTLAIMMARRGMGVGLWARTPEEAQRLAQDGENRARLPGFPFPPGLLVTSSLEEALSGAEMTILAVPSQTMRGNVAQAHPYLARDTILLSAAKGLEVETGKRMSQAMAEEAPALTDRIAVLSGPNLSQEIARGLPASAVAASSNKEVALQAQRLLMSPVFRVYTSEDVVGVELGGALKNIIALGAGMSDGLGYGDNAKAALMARGLAEITRLGVALGANHLTFSGLAGLGDLVATCSSPLSRNHYVGVELARGRPLQEVLASMNQVAEGMPTTVAARRLARERGVEMPIAEGMYRVLYEGLEVRRAVAELLAREAKPEWWGVGS
ncbi:MAG: NAD(P)-dependent glycerol-3-phosphate dehydrogenase [Chloroflexi bacterium]|nr:NAD(P)-dependent glycerol-3-phosphate dehydrogenase [Chloroflexota bacterium]